MKKANPDILKKWRKIRRSDGYHNIVLFVVFVVLSALFWFILAMNDKVSRSFDIALNIVNKPDSVTFITDPPATFHVTLQDKGTVLFRSGVMRHPQIDLNFVDFASGGRFRLSAQDISAALKDKFGNSVTVASTSLDSLNVKYTTEPGKVVPLKIRTDLRPAFGFVIGKKLFVSNRMVRIFSTDVSLDTINFVESDIVIKRDLSETSIVNVKINPIAGVKIVPSQVRLKIPVEPLVRKQSIVEVTVDNVPPTKNLLLFPSQVEVEYFLPMNMFDSPVEGIEAHADYMEVADGVKQRIHVRVTEMPPYCVNPTIANDSLEYTIVSKTGD